MDHRVYCALLIFLMVMGFPQAVEKKYSHPGDIVDADTKQGIRADATAYGSDVKESDEDCPKYKEQLDVTHSDPGTGDFYFKINDQRKNYVATYCQGAYVPRTVRDNDNTKENTRVQPDPIQLYPNVATLKARHLDGVEFADRAIGSVLDRAHQDLEYYAHADEAAFYSALEKGSKADRDVVKYLLARPQNASLRPKAATK